MTHPQDRQPTTVEADMYHRQADTLATAGRLDEAESACRSGLVLAPQNARLLFLLATIHQRKGASQEAAAAYEQSLGNNPDNAVAQYNLGLIYHEQGQLKAAEQCFRNAVRIRPRYFKAYNNLGSLLLEMKQTAAATECYRHALQCKPDSVEVLLNLCITLGREEKYQEAILCGQQAAEKAPNDINVWMRLGTVQSEARDVKGAIASMKRVLELDPQSELARFYLASQGEYQGAIPGTMPKELIQSLFDGYADKFEQHLVYDLRYRVPELLYMAVADVLGGNNRKLRALDLGCGTGLCGIHFRSMASRLVGVDLSPKMIAKTKERNLYDELIVGDVSVPLRAPDAVYDLVLSADVFVYVGDLKEVFRDCKRVLAPGGLFAFSVEAHPGDSYILHAKQRYAHSLAYLRSLAQEVNLQEVRVDDIVVRMEGEKPVGGFLVIFRQP